MMYFSEPSVRILMCCESCGEGFVRGCLNRSILLLKIGGCARLTTQAPDSALSCVLFSGQGKKQCEISNQVSHKACRYTGYAGTKVGMGGNEFERTRICNDGYASIDDCHQIFTLAGSLLAASRNNQIPGKGGLIGLVDDASDELGQSYDG